MLRRVLTITILLLPAALWGPGTDVAHADPGDTTWVRTFDHDTGVRKMVLLP